MTYICACIYTLYILYMSHAYALYIHYTIYNWK